MILIITIILFSQAYRFVSYSFTPVRGVKNETNGL
jgi:hypothetical protein